MVYRGLKNSVDASKRDFADQTIKKKNDVKDTLLIELSLYIALFSVFLSGDNIENAEYQKTKYTRQIYTEDCE